MYTNRDLLFKNNNGFLKHKSTKNEYNWTTKRVEACEACGFVLEERADGG